MSAIFSRVQLAGDAVQLKSSGCHLEGTLGPFQPVATLA